MSAGTKLQKPQQFSVDNVAQTGKVLENAAEGAHPD